MSAHPLPERLWELAELVGRMCAGATEAMQLATAALVDGRDRLAVKVIAEGSSADELRSRLEQVASEALVLHGPVAGDLRAVVAAIRGAGDAERMAKLALHVAEAAHRRHPGVAVPVEVAPAFRAMGQCAVGLGRKAAEVARTRNVLLAVDLQAEDDTMDELHRRVFSVLMHPSWPHGVAAAVDVALLARWYERFADHTVKIARQTVYAVTGRTPETLAI